MPQKFLQVKVGSELHSAVVKAAKLRGTTITGLVLKGLIRTAPELVQPILDDRS